MRVTGLPRVAVLASVLGAGLACAAPVTLGLAPHLARAAGQSPTNCGVFRYQLTLPHKLNAEQAQQVSACINEAYSKREPFVFSLEGPGIDSYLATGLLGTTGGLVRRFWYDSAPCGGPQCGESFKTVPCMVDSTVPLDPAMTCEPSK